LQHYHQEHAEDWLQSRVEKQAFQVTRMLVDTVINRLQSRVEKQAFQVENTRNIKDLPIHIQKSVAIPRRKAGISSL